MVLATASRTRSDKRQRVAPEMPGRIASIKVPARNTFFEQVTKMNLTEVSPRPQDREGSGESENTECYTFGRTKKTRRAESAPCSESAANVERRKKTQASARARASFKIAHASSFARKSITNNPGLTETQTKLLAQNSRIILPGSVWYFWWRCLVSFVVLAAVVALPLGAAFSTGLSSDRTTFAVVGVVGSLLFLIDAAFASIASFVDPTLMEVVYDAKKVRNRYFKSLEFPLDMLSSLPVDVVLIGLGSSLRLALFMRLAAVLPRLRNVNRFVYSMERSKTMHSDEIRIMKMGFSMLLCAHLLATTFWVVGGATESGGLEPGGWVARYAEQFDESLFNTDVEGGRVGARYVTALYWSITTILTIGLGDIVPTTRDEKLFTIFAMLIGVTMYSAILASVTSLVTNMNYSEARYKSRLRRMADFLRHNPLPPVLSGRILGYYDYIHEQSSTVDFDDVLADLPPQLKTEVATTLHLPLIEEINIFAGCSNAFLVSLVAALHTQICLPGDTLIFQNEMGHELFILKRGQVSVHMVEEESGRCWRGTLTSGAYFGELSLLVPRQRHATIRAIACCEVMMLFGTAFSNVAELYEGDAAIVAENAMVHNKTHRTSLGHLIDKDILLRDFSAHHSPLLAAQRSLTECSTENGSGAVDQDRDANGAAKLRRHSSFPSSKFSPFTNGDSARDQSAKTKRVKPNNFTAVVPVDELSVEGVMAVEDDDDDDDGIQQTATSAKMDDNRRRPKTLDGMRSDSFARRAMHMKRKPSFRADGTLGFRMNSLASLVSSQDTVDGEGKKAKTPTNRQPGGGFN